MKHDISTVEMEELSAYFETEEGSRLLNVLLKQHIEAQGDNVTSDLQQQASRIKNAAWSNIESHIREANNSIKQNVFRIYNWMPYAVGLLVVAAVSFLFLNRHYKNDTENLLVEENRITPGGNRATLILADGRTLSLDEKRKGIVMNDDGIIYDDGKSIILPGEGRVSESFTLTTPKGGTYELVLPDGTKVWLNAASTLTYPGRFNTNERYVQLEGEAFFDVSKKVKSTGARVPFIVQSPTQRIEVLGTAFNIMDYADESSSRTTLVHGSVKIHAYSSSNQAVVLKPGEQSVYAGDLLSKSKVDTALFCAWKNDKFLFQDTKIKDALQQLSRWYDFDVVYEGTIKETYFYGEFSRKSAFVDVLKVLEKSGIYSKLKVDGKRRKLIVSM
ncbi:DUF4974 domain-containing protein [Sphingobacterium sp. SGG-5]|uniref:FecR family protein n=1 Tax=Sphingobacterium sp. SGG-5 TaxID=2710881 RepID=UPI0013ED6F73|nr:FecR family protein [Sphingobacterium sp. SGG-5]NGM63584.1 DUF4974 domain-containing protein [Sphingobacterium sp. SGG-5]